MPTQKISYKIDLRDYNDPDEWKFPIIDGKVIHDVT